MSIFDIFRTRKKIKTPWNKYYTKEDLNISIPNISMYDQVLASSIRYPDNVAIYYFNRKITYKKLIKKI